MEDIHRLYANTTFYMRDLSIRGFWYQLESWNQSPRATKGQSCIAFAMVTRGKGECPISQVNESL